MVLDRKRDLEKSRRRETNDDSNNSKHRVKYTCHYVDN